MHVPRPLYAEIKQDRPINFHPVYSYPIGKFHSNFMPSSSQMDNHPANIVSGVLDSETTVYEMKP